MSFKLLVFGTGRYLLAEPEIDGRRQSSINHVGSMNTGCIQLHSRVIKISPLADLCSLTSRNFTFRRTSDITPYSLKFPPRKYSITSPDNPNFQLFAFNTLWLLIESVSEFSIQTAGVQARPHSASLNVKACLRRVTRRSSVRKTSSSWLSASRMPKRSSHQISKVLLKLRICLRRALREFCLSGILSWAFLLLESVLVLLPLFLSEPSC